MSKYWYDEIKELRISSDKILEYLKTLEESTYLNLAIQNLTDSRMFMGKLLEFNLPGDVSTYEKAKRKREAGEDVIAKATDTANLPLLLPESKTVLQVFDFIRDLIGADSITLFGVRRRYFYDSVAHDTGYQFSAIHAAAYERIVLAKMYLGMHMMEEAKKNGTTRIE